MSAQNPRVSVIVRTKDRLESLQACLDSVAQQDYQPLQVVVVNDGGADVAQVVAAFQSQIEVCLVQLPVNEGRTRAANHGLESASGDYICFLDDDDYWLPSHLSCLVSNLLAVSDIPLSQRGFPDCAIHAATKAVSVDGNGRESDIKVTFAKFDRDYLRYNNFLPILSVLFSRSIVDEGVRFDESFDLFEDWDFWLQVSHRLPFLSVSDVTSVYRIHSQASGVHQSDRVADAYQQIYRKWLIDCAPEALFQLLYHTHRWHDESIAQLQQDNQSRLDSIGKQHAHALSIIENRDKQLAEANIELARVAEEYKHCIQTIEEKDQAQAQLLTEYNHALSVVNEKDRATSELLKDYQHAISVIEEKDKATSQLLEEYNHAIEVIQQKDKAAEQLVSEYNYAILIIEQKDREAAGKEKTILELSDNLACMAEELAGLRQEIEVLRDKVKRPFTTIAKRVLGREQ
ncbi:MAG: glycosyltransferase [Hahellaceae bacterium]|nr:glycosyltransferase [Hahellaceae bacterium]